MNRLDIEEAPIPESEEIYPGTLAEAMHEVDMRVTSGDTAQLRPVATGFSPLDDVLNGGLRAGDLLIIGGPFGVGKTIWGLQTARNVVLGDPEARALYVCYEHDRAHIMSRLMCLESAELGHRENALTLRRIAQLMLNAPAGQGFFDTLRRMPRYAEVVRAMESYADRLVLVKASGDHSTLDHIREWTQDVYNSSGRRLLLVVDYLQKIPVSRSVLRDEVEVTTYLTQGLKELAMSLQTPVIAIAASDRLGLRAKRMRLSDLRGSSALQYEADIGLILNNKHAIVSREHMVFNPTQAEAMRNWVVMSVEKNRAGRNALDMEYALDAAHFRIVPEGGFVRERLVDEKVVLE